MSPVLGFGRSKADRDGWVPAEALVLSGDSGISGTTSWLSLVDLQVTVPGNSPVLVSHECMVNRDKELVAGQVVPITADPHDPTKLELRWEEIPTLTDRIANRDPVVFDPDGTWHTVQQAWHQLSPLHPVQPAPWSAQIEGWPPTEQLKHGRQPGTAWVISQSADARACTNGDSVMPPGRTHYRCSGPVSYGPHAFMSWMLLCVNPEYGDRYGVHLRTNVVRWRNARVLPVAIDPEKPADLEFCWDYAPNLAKAIAKRVNTAVDEMNHRVATITAQKAETAAAAAAPVTGLERLERLRSSGVLTDAEFETERAKLIAGT